MNLHFDVRALKEFKKFDKTVQGKFRLIFKHVKNERELPSRAYKKIGKLHEYRVKHNKNIYRALAGYTSEGVLVVLFFQKKSKNV